VTLAIAQGFRVTIASIYVQEYVPTGEITVKKTKEGGINELKKDFHRSVHGNEAA